MKRVLLIIILLSAASPARAEDDSALCRFWNTHRPSADVAYRPDADVHGNPVVPADIDAPMPSLLPSRVTFPLTVDMAQAFNIPVPPGTEMDADFGMIEVYTDGKVLFNGQDISAQAQVACTGKAAGLPVPQQAESPPAAQPPEPLKPGAKENNDDIIWGEGH